MVTQKEWDELNEAMDEVMNRLPSTPSVGIRPEVRRLGDVLEEFFDVHAGDPECEEFRKSLVKVMIEALKRRALQ